MKNRFGKPKMNLANDMMDVHSALLTIFNIYISRKVIYAAICVSHDVLFLDQGY